MKVTELLEQDQKKAFTAVFKLGRHSREQHFTHKTIANLKILSPAEMKRVLKLDVGATLSTQFSGEEGRTMVHVTRTR
jgi:hypothetical protein